MTPAFNERESGAVVIVRRGRGRKRKRLRWWLLGCRCRRRRDERKAWGAEVGVLLPKLRHQSLQPPSFSVVAFTLKSESSDLRLEIVEVG